MCFSSSMIWCHDCQYRQAVICARRWCRCRCKCAKRCFPALMQEVPVRGDRCHLEEVSKEWEEVAHGIVRRLRWRSAGSQGGGT